jgi:hypothetical protein
MKVMRGNAEPLNATQRELVAMFVRFLRIAGDADIYRVALDLLYPEAEAAFGAGDDRVYEWVTARLEAIGVHRPVVKPKTLQAPLARPRFDVIEGGGRSQ